MAARIRYRQKHQMCRSALSVQLLRVGYQRIRLANQLARTRLGDAESAAKFRVFQDRQDLPGDEIAGDGYVAKLLLKLRVGTVVRRIALQRGGGDVQRRQAQRANGSVYLLERLPQCDHRCQVIAYSRRQSRWLDDLEERAPFMAIVVLQAEQ